MIRRTLSDRQCLLCLVLILALGSWGQAAGMDLSGELGYDLHYLTETESYGSSRLTYKLNLDGESGPASAYHLSFEGHATYRPELALSAFELNEAYFDAYLEKVDLRVGRQVINWGTADGINPTNEINPKDYTTLSEFELKGTPVPAIMAAYYGPSGAGITGVVVLDYVPAEIPPMVMDRFGAMDLVPLGGPKGDGDQLEFALRAEMPIQGWPVYATYFNGWDDLPALWLELELDPGTGSPVPKGVRARHRRLQSAGLATAMDYRGAALWLEGAYKMPGELKKPEDPLVVAITSDEPYWQLIAGADYSFDSGLYASGQVLYNQGGSILSPYHNPSEEKPEAQTYVLLRGQYSPKDRHDLELVGLINATDEGALVIPQYTYELADATKLSLRGVVATGDKKSEFAALKDHVQGINLGLQISF